MNKLPPAAASLLEQARQHDRAHQVDLEPALRGLHATLPFAAVGPALALGEAQGGEAAGGGLQPAPLESVAPAALKTLATGSVLTGKAAKVLLATLALGGAVGGVTLSAGPARRSEQRAPAAQVSPDRRPSPAALERPAPTPAAAHPVQEPERVAAPASPAPRVAAAERPSRVLHARSSAPTEATRVLPAATAPVAARTDVGAPPAEPQATPASPASAARAASELDLIDSALAQLRSSAAPRALALLEQHAARYPKGRFRIEREGLRVLALCQSGRTGEGRSAQSRFLREHGGVPIAAQVRAACVEPGER